jgi:hypothetical protein
MPPRNKLRDALAAAEHTAQPLHDGVGWAGRQDLEYKFIDDPPPSLTTRIRDLRSMQANADALEATIHRQTDDLAVERREITALKRAIAAELGITEEHVT